MNLKVELEYEIESTVGEGPIWDEISQQLVWIDVLEGKIFIYSPTRRSQKTIEIETHIGAVAFDSNHDLVIAQRDGISRYSRSTGEITYVRQIIESSEIRFNDGSVDRAGRFVVGSMGYEPSEDSGTLYSYSLSGELRTLLPKVGISNGICWNSDSSAMYYIDSLTNSIQVFDYNLESGAISNGKVMVKFDMTEGTPDGMTIDTDGNLWVAMWGGAKVVVVNPDGITVARIPFPVTNVTSVTFGGADMSTLFVTTARYTLSDEVLLNEPLAGSLFSIQTNSRGYLENCMK